MPFVHLRTHTEFSVVDGTLRIDDAAAAAKAQEESAAAGAAKGDDLGDLKRELSEMRDRLDKLAKTK